MDAMSSGLNNKLSHAILGILVTCTEKFRDAILATWSQMPFHLVYINVIKFEFAMLHVSENNIIIIPQDQS